MDYLEYNSEREHLIIPEYGRYIQKMIRKATEEKDAEKRSELAKAIIEVMGNMNPHLRDVPDFQHKLWDQLFIMSDFKLDVESPFPKPSREELERAPKPLPYPQNHPRYRFYGNNIKRMIDVCISWEDGDEKTALKYTIANHMKRCYLNWNKDTVEDEVIFKHLYELSNGQINLARFDEDLTKTKDLVQNNNKKIQERKKESSLQKEISVKL